MGKIKHRVGIGHDTHRLESGRPLILGGVRIDHELGLAGHSDADIVLHALTDALLGAVSEGDIGDHFPDDDPSNAGRASHEFLAHSLELVNRNGLHIANADIIIHAQKPRLSKHKQHIKDSIARMLGIEPAQVNIKAKTGENVGPVGRLEAMECHAIVLLTNEQQG